MSDDTDQNDSEEGRQPDSWQPYNKWAVRFGVALVVMLFIGLLMLARHREPANEPVDAVPLGVADGAANYVSS